MRRVFFAALLAAAFCLCLAAPALAAPAADPLPPVEAPTEQMSDAALKLASGEASSGEPSGNPSGEASSDEPSAEAEETVPPLVPGKFEGPDGSVLNVKDDGTCTYETTVSGTVNGQAMSGRLTFHGTVEDGKFTFTKVTFFGLDLTKIAEEAGYTDASPWEEEAGALYAGGLAS